MQPCLGINMCHISKLFNCPTKKRIITGIKPRSPTDSVFKELKLLKCTDINKYLVDRLMYRVYNNDYQLFQAMFVMNKHVHSHSTRQSDHYHVPLFKTRLGKSGLRFNGATVWNNWNTTTRICKWNPWSCFCKISKVINIILQIVLSYLQSSNNYTGGAVWLCDVSNGLVLEIQQSCTEPSIWKYWADTAQLQLLHPKITNHLLVSQTRAHKPCRVSCFLCSYINWIFLCDETCDKTGVTGNLLHNAVLFLQQCCDCLFPLMCLCLFLSLFIFVS